MNKISDLKKVFGEDAVLIIENVGQSLKASGTTLEGVCAVFGQVNNNRRIYEKEEYLPHLSYLQEKITKRQLTGDLDHPQHFDVRMKDASHLITELRYDGADRVYIKLNILETTPSGRIAKALLDGGVNLSISSRAAGTVNESGRVKLQRIFTYDLVGEPGFTEAILRKAVNESLKNEFEMITEAYSGLRDASIVRQKELVNISESLGYGENVKIYRINNEDGGITMPIPVEKGLEKNEGEMKDFVTRDQMTKYSDVIKKQFASIGKELKELRSVSESKTAGAADIATNESVLAHIDKLTEVVEGVVNFTNYLSAKMNESIKYTQHVAETTNSAIAFGNYLSNMLNESIGHQDHIATKLNEAINFAEYLRKNINETIKYQGYLAEELDRGLQYAEYVAEGANRSIEYGEHIATEVNKSRDYSEYLAEKVAQTIGYSEHIVNEINSSGLPNKRNLLGGVEKVEGGVDKLVEGVERLIQEVTTDSAKAVLESKHPFLKVLSDENRNKFYSLDNKTKQAIVETLNGAIWFNESDVLSIMEAVVNQEKKELPILVRFMPDEYKAVWESMNDGEKSRVFAKAQLYELRTPYQVKRFWDELDLRGINERIETEKNNMKLQKLNESQGPEGHIPVERVVEMQRGYSQNYIDALIRRGQNR